MPKNVFAQESQFWPGAFKDPKEFGLGQITDNGAEALLLWNPSFYNQFCPLVLNKSQCERGYVYLNKESQAVLRGALAVEAKTDCPGCAAGLDLANANFSIKLFAQAILANCSQVSRIVYNATGKSPGSVMDYENLDVDGSFACMYKDGKDMFMFRNDNEALFFDDDFNVCSLPFSGSNTLPPNRVYKMDMNKKKIKEIDEFQTVRHWI